MYPWPRPLEPPSKSISQAVDSNIDSSRFRPVPFPQGLYPFSFLLSPFLISSAHGHSPSNAQPQIHIQISSLFVVPGLVIIILLRVLLASGSRICTHLSSGGEHTALHLPLWFCSPCGIAISNIVRFPVHLGS